MEPSQTVFDTFSLLSDTTFVYFRRGQFGGDVILRSRHPARIASFSLTRSHMTAAAWATLLITFAIAITMPGVDTFLLLRLGIRQRRAALIAACGIMIGNTVWTVASLLGLAALLRALPGGLPALQLLGSAVLVWMGVQSIRGGLTARSGRRLGVGAPQAPVPEPARALTDRPLRLGVITNLSNPKALLFYAALFSQILPSNAGWLDRAAILIVLTVVGLAWFLSFALLTSSRAFQRWFGRATPYIDIAAGAVFILVAGVILVELAVLWFA